MAEKEKSIIPISVTEKRKKQIEERAEKEGRSVSNYLRWCEQHYSNCPLLNPKEKESIAEKLFTPEFLAKMGYKKEEE